MATFNQCSFIGRLGKDPELQVTGNGKPYTRFSLAVDQGKDQQPMWLNVTTWDKLAETVEQYATKGMQVFVQGKLQIRSYIDKDKATRQAIDIVAFTVCYWKSPIAETWTAPCEAALQYSATARPITEMVGEIHGLLHKALDDAVKWGLVARNVCDLFDRPHVEKKETPVLDKDQALVLLESVKQHRLGVLLLVVLTTGMRRGELLALRWADVNLDKGSLFVNKTVDYIPHYGYVENGPKSKSGCRTIKLATFVVGILKAHQKRQHELKAKVGSKWVEKDLVYCGMTGNYFNPNYLLRLFKKVLVEAGLPHMRFHDLRHSAATILLAMGIHPKVVQELLGHSSFLITMNLYGHVFPSMLDEVVEKWNKEFQDNP